jgi:putative hydrolase of HD superfamily
VKPDNLIDFLQIAGKLKTISRTGWVELGVGDPESVADHSFLTALTAMVLSDSMGLDTCKVMQMTLLHDLAEAEIGDMTPEQKKSNHREYENQAMKKILSILDESLREQYWEIWIEYQNNETPEAVLVNDSDKIDMALQALEYWNRSNIQELDRFLHIMVSPARREIVDTIKRRKNIL